MSESVKVEVEISVEWLKDLFDTVGYRVKDADAFTQLINTPAFKQELADDIRNSYGAANDTYGDGCDAFESFADIVLSVIPEAQDALKQVEYN